MKKSRVFGHALATAVVSLGLLIGVPACGGDDDDGSGGRDAGVEDVQNGGEDGDAYSGTGGDGGLTHGSGQRGDSCEQHSDCAEGLYCSPKGECFAGSVGQQECKADRDCPGDQICDQLYTECVEGECDEDSDCETNHCDRNGIRGESYSCVECESDDHCPNGTCDDSGSCVSG